MFNLREKRNGLGMKVNYGRKIGMCFSLILKLNKNNSDLENTFRTRLGYVELVVKKNRAWKDWIELLAEGNGLNTH